MPDAVCLLAQARTLDIDGEGPDAEPRCRMRVPAAASAWKCVRAEAVGARMLGAEGRDAGLWLPDTEGWGGCGNSWIRPVACC